MGFGFFFTSLAPAVGTSRVPRDSGVFNVFYTGLMLECFFRANQSPHLQGVSRPPPDPGMDLLAFYGLSADDQDAEGSGTSYIGASRTWGRTETSTLVDVVHPFTSDAGLGSPTAPRVQTWECPQPRSSTPPETTIRTPNRCPWLLPHPLRLLLPFLLFRPWHRLQSGPRCELQTCLISASS